MFSKQKYSSIITLMLVTICSFLGFTFLYFTDNKYTEDSIYGYNGTINLSKNDFNKNPTVQLCYGWDVYPKEYVPYKDIQNRTAPLNIFIGQYSGMDFGIKDDSYFGKATYNLKLLLPEKIQSYTLELPEIFSSYELYINGNLLAKCGDINNATYKEATKKSSVSFLAQKSIDITLYVSNYSHIYGGLVYPPAFGTQDGISKLLTGRIIFNSMFLFISFTLCILFLLAGLKINKIYSIYALLTLVFIGYTSYPITHSLFTTSIWTYHIEIFCYYLFIALVLYLQNKIFVIEDKDKIIYTHTFNFHNKAYNTVQILNNILLSVSCIIILFTFLPAKVICMNTVTLTLYSLLLTGYKYSVFLYLIVTTFIAVINNIKYSKLLLIGFCIVAASFFADRIFSLFEPIHFAWFYEISGFILICIIGLILIMTFSEIYIKNQKLNTQIDMQKSYYSLVSENIYNTRKMRHDLRNHILVIKTFLEEKNISKLYNYIETYAKELPTFNEITFCSNESINILFTYYVNIASQKNITVSINSLNIPQNLKVPSPDLCVILGNLFTNAIEACEKVHNAQPIIKINSKVSGQKFFMTFDNTYEIEPVIIDSYFLSSKRIKEEGIGIPSIKKLVEKNNGSIKFNINKNTRFFEVSLLF